MPVLRRRSGVFGRNAIDKMQAVRRHVHRHKSAHNEVGSERGLEQEGK
nr:MAG TPA: hypothetical protein [Caudoviricetes sp.]